MPTIITHSVVGLAAGKVLGLPKLPKHFWLLTFISTILPDADVLGFSFGIPYNDFFGHRGFFHSIPFAFVWSLVVVSGFYWREGFFSRKWLILLGYFFVLTSSHGLLDACTNGGEGIALFSPFDDTRYFLPFTPIQVSPIGIRSFLSEWGVRTLISEAVWVWLPVSVLVAVVQTGRYLRRGGRQ